MRDALLSNVVGRVPGYCGGFLRETDQQEGAARKRAALFAFQYLHVQT